MHKKKKKKKKKKKADPYFAILKSAILSLAMIMTSPWRHIWDFLVLILAYGKGRPLALLLYQLHVSGGFTFKFIGDSNHPPLLRRHITKKKKKKKQEKKKGGAWYDEG